MKCTRTRALNAIIFSALVAGICIGAVLFAMLAHADRFGEFDAGADDALLDDMGTLRQRAYSELDAVKSDAEADLVAMNEEPWSASRASNDAAKHEKLAQLVVKHSQEIIRELPPPHESERSIDVGIYKCIL